MGQPRLTKAQATSIFVAYDKVAEKKAGENALFKEIVESQKAFAARAVRWDMDNNVNRRMAYNHYFGKSAGAPAAADKKKA